MARTFDGSDDRINCGSGSTLDNLPTAGDFTITAWVYRTADGSGAGTPRLVEKSDEFSGTGWLFLLTKSSQSPASALRYIEIYSGDNRNRISAASAVADDTWTFVAATIGTGETATNVHLYTATTGVITEVSYDTTTNATGTYTSDAGDSLSIGNDAGEVQGFEGRLAEVRIYTRILAIGEMESVRRGKHLGSSVLHMPILGRSAEPDYSGNGNNGTLTGTTVADHPPVGPTFGFDYGWQGAFTVAAATTATHPQLSLLGVGA